MASQNGFHRVVEKLIEKKANPNALFLRGYPPIYIASQNGHLSVCEALVKNGANINSVTNKGATALYVAAQKGYLEIVKLLLNNNANHLPFENGFYAIHIAAREAQLAVIKYLLLHVKDPQVKKYDINKIAMLKEIKVLLLVKQYLVMSKEMKKTDKPSSGLFASSSKKSDVKLIQKLFRECLKDDEYNFNVFNKKFSTAEINDPVFLKLLEPYLPKHKSKQFKPS